MKHLKGETTVTLASIDNFRSSLFETGRSEQTVKAYSTDMRMLLADLRVQEIPLESLERTAAQWLTTTRKIVKPKTLTRRITSLRAYGKWAGLGTILVDYKAPTPAKGDPHPLPEGVNGVRRLLDATRNEKQRALIALCGLCGCRVAEALAVRPSDIDMSRMLLTIRGKGDKTRRVPISPEAWEVIQQPVVRAFCNGDAPVVGLADRFARRVITDLGEKAELQRRISSHDLRATFATEVYNKTLDIRVVQLLLGHGQSSTTELYIGVEQDKLVQAVNL